MYKEKWLNSDPLEIDCFNWLIVTHSRLITLCSSGHASFINSLACISGKSYANVAISQTAFSIDISDCEGIIRL